MQNNFSYQEKLLSLCLLFFLCLGTSESKPPNVLLLFVDDLGYGDLGCQGNTSVVSPNIDKLASEGVRFTQWLSASSICTPSRGALLTGRLPVRLGLASGVYYERVLQPLSPGGLQHDELTLAEALKGRGFLTHMTGKWHLGIGKNGKFLPTNHGFDHFYGLGVTNVQSCMPGKTIYVQDTLAEYIWDNTHKVWLGMGMAALLTHLVGFLSVRGLGCSILVVVLLFLLVVKAVGIMTLMSPTMCLLYQDLDIIQQPLNLFNLTQRHTHNAENFIRYATGKDKPWFLYMSYAKVHTALFTNPEFVNVGESDYIDNIAELDWSVGYLLDLLDELGIGDDTIVWFSSDNGPFLERGIEGGSAGKLRNAEIKGGKGQVWEGGIRVPGIVRYSSKFPKGRVTEQAVSTMDIFPTTIAIVDRELKFRTRTKGAGIIDGKDITSLIMSAGIEGEEKSPHDFMIHYCGDILSAVRIDSRYKALFYSTVWEEGYACPTATMCECVGSGVRQHSPPILFDLLEDPGEERELTRENFPAYDQIITRVDNAVKIHLKSIDDSPNQPSQVKMTQTPLLLPHICCNFPSCECDKEEDPGKMFYDLNSL